MQQACCIALVFYRLCTKELRAVQMPVSLLSYCHVKESLQALLTKSGTEKQHPGKQLHMVGKADYLTYSISGANSSMVTQFIK